MSNVLIRDVPEDVHAALQARASAANQSLQQFLTMQLSRIATTPTMEEVLSRIARSSGGGSVGLAQAVADIDNARSER